jgi:hypothetical protein
MSEIAALAALVQRLLSAIEYTAARIDELDARLDRRVEMAMQDHVDTKLELAELRCDHEVLRAAAGFDVWPLPAVKPKARLRLVVNNDTPQGGRAEARIDDAKVVES